MERRVFLKTAGIGLAATTLVPVAGCAGPTRKTIMTRPMSSTMNGIAGTSLDEASVRILHFASMAASSHNIQPWRVKIPEPRRWIVCADPARRLPAVDLDNREPILSVGAFLENLSLAAGSMGYSVEMECLSDDRFAYELVEVRLTEATPTGYPLERITNRRTLRNGYADLPISDAHVASLLEPFRGQGHFYAQDSEEGLYLRENTLAAFCQQSWRDDAQAELAGWIHFDSGEASREKDGLTTKTMEINGLAGFFVRTFYDKQKVMSEGFREKGIQGVAEQVTHAGGWMATSAADLSVPALLEAGRQLQGMLLLAREMGIAVHPMTQMIQESPWKEQVASTLGIPGALQLILRVGYVESYPEPVSLRKPVEEFVVA
jgi:nitroreductase